ncbi:PIN domain-containing protein [Methylobacterium brachiatum]|uniref:PIN domain-containing protein n=1 Tax=Methylobacterium brachiatum TaxID=269660 RepID=UPI0008EE8690|nr:type II toxin-antitoxin system VapC family toxin [Methylobacterium brachiatum]MDF2601917.1 Pil-like protein [Methylobacterium brachiatum]CAA2160417.1 tRNA(fMet)-specific endonuclease VapC [Methylobacterium brachiatum]SFI56697.1 Predicted nucleic-acid-binding protein, contains PIN domain [Methylobacterium brachiatum]
MIGLDTNVLLRWLVDETVWPDDTPEQTVLATEALSRRDAQFFVNAVVLAETVWILARPLRQKKPALVSVIRRLLNASNVVVDHREAAEVALSAWAGGRGDFADHLIGAINRSAGCKTTLTFDRKAEPADAFTQLRREP